MLLTEPNSTAQNREKRHAGQILEAQVWHEWSERIDEMTGRRLTPEELTCEQESKGQIVPNHTNKRF